MGRYLDMDQGTVTPSYATPEAVVKGGEKVDHYGGGIVYHRHDER